MKYRLVAVGFFLGLGTTVCGDPGNKAQLAAVDVIDNDGEEDGDAAAPERSAPSCDGGCGVEPLCGERLIMNVDGVCAESGLRRSCHEKCCPDCEIDCDDPVAWAMGMLTPTHDSLSLQMVLLTDAVCHDDVTCRLYNNCSARFMDDERFSIESTGRYAQIVGVDTPDDQRERSVRFSGTSTHHRGTFRRAFERDVHLEIAPWVTAYPIWTRTGTIDIKASGTTTLDHYEGRTSSWGEGEATLVRPNGDRWVVTWSFRWESGFEGCILEPTAATIRLSVESAEGQHVEYDIRSKECDGLLSWTVDGVDQRPFHSPPFPEFR